jgi:hypothetical protein
MHNGASFVCHHADFDEAIVQLGAIILLCRSRCILATIKSNESVSPSNVSAFNVEVILREDISDVISGHYELEGRKMWAGIVRQSPPTFMQHATPPLTAVDSRTRDDDFVAIARGADDTAATAICAATTRPVAAAAPTAPAPAAASTTTTTLRLCTRSDDIIEGHI